MTKITAAVQRDFDADRFRQALGRFPTGVTIVTTRSADGRPVGVTASSFNSVSLEPPLVLWSIGHGSTSHAAFTSASHWAVHVLGLEQQPLARQFAQRGIDRFAGLAVESGLHGLPLLPGCAARFECRATARHEAGDHSILIGEVLRLELGASAPLLFHASRFTALHPGED